MLKPLRPIDDRALLLLSRVGAGAVAFALGTFALALVGGIYRWSYLPVFAVTAMVGLVVAAREARTVEWPRLRTWRGWELALLALIGCYVVVELVVTCAPISSADALLHHAAAPELYARVHEYRELPWTWNSYQPYSVEMLILDGLLLHDLVQGAFAPLLLGLGALAAVFGGAYRLLGRSGAVLAAAVFWAQPFTAWISTSTFVEPGGAFFIALAAWNLIEFARRGSTTALVLTGVFAGAAAGTKYFAAAAAAVLCVVGAVAVRDRLTIRRVGLVAGIALAVAAPWYLKNAVLTGDPLYPLLRGWPNDDARRAALDSIDSYGYGTSATDLLALPFRLLGDAEPFDRGEFMSPLILLFAPVALLASRGRRVIALALAGSAAFVLLWFFGAQHARFLMPTVPVLSVLAATGILALAAAGRTARWVTAAVCAGALLAGAAITVAYSAQFVPVALGLESREQFLRENTPYYDGLEWLNEHAPNARGVLLDHVLVLYSDAPAVAWTADALPSTARPRELRALVRRYDITHAEVFASSRDKRRLLAAIGAKQIGKVTVHGVTSRTLSELGPPQTMLVYELPQG